MKYFIVLLCALLSAASFADTIGSTDDSSTIGGGARALGMGRAYTAIADEADALLINPAGAAGIKSPEIMTMQTSILGEVYYNELCGAAPAAGGVVSVGYVSTGASNVLVPLTDSSVYADYYDSMLLLSYSSPLSRYFEYGKNVFVGGNFKLLSRGWSGGYTQAASGYSVDLGLKYIMTPYFSVGINKQNILPISLSGVIHWSTGADEAMASITKVGFAVKPIPFKGNLLFSCDADLPAESTRPLTMHSGLELKINRYIAVRGGLDQMVDASTASKTSWMPALGVSLGFVGMGTFRVDYAYHPFYNNAELASSYISLYYQAEPVFALKGEVH